MLRRGRRRKKESGYKISTPVDDSHILNTGAHN